MISLSGAVTVVLYLLIGAVVFGLLYWLINVVGSLFSGEASALFIKAARVILAVLAVLVLIGLLLSLVQGQPLFRP